MAGLTAAVQLCDAGQSIALLEATDRVGGRVRTDVIDDFTLDHGFQVLLTAYPACRRMLDYQALRLRSFDPGALLRHRGRFATLSDPWRRPTQALATALNPALTLRDKLLIAKLRKQSRRGTLDELYKRDAVATVDRLHRLGFSTPCIDHFFRPFLGGVFLDDSLAVSSRMLEFVFRMFAEDEVAVPADGMAAIPRQLSERLPRGVIQFEQTVTAIGPNRVHLADGRSLAANQIVIASDNRTAAKLLDAPNLETPWNETTTLYYSASHRPDPRKMLMLCGDESGPIQTATVLSNVAPEYAPGDRALISVSLRPSSSKTDEIDAMDASVRSQLNGWFGPSVDNWDRLMIYRIPFGLPARRLDPVQMPVRATHLGGADNVFLCGDHCETPSIEGAMNSGLRVADAILQD